MPARRSHPSLTPIAFTLAVAALLVCGPALAGELRWQPRTGDVVFHTSTSAQSQAVQQATRSRWSHVGMVVAEGTGWAVVEAVQPVRVVPLRDWLDRGVDGRYAVYRLKQADAVLTADAQTELATAARAFVGRDYDPFFGWSDDRIYCSELVWKAFERALDVELGTPHPVTDFDLEAPAVVGILAKRFPDGLPEGEVAVSPQDLADSALLERIARK